MPLKILALMLALAGLYFRYRFVRARQRGYIGPARRRIVRGRHGARFHVALAAQALGALICFASALACLTSSFHRL